MAGDDRGRTTENETHMTIKYVGKDTTSLSSRKEAGGTRILDLLWGDGVEVVDTQGARTKVRARGRSGWVDTADLDGRSLLEVYFIDVGQGDGVLVRTPDGRHVMIDGGFKRRSQPTVRNAADFVDWKFAKDYRRPRIEIDAMIASHNDADHYGGLWDLVNPEETDELDLPGDVRIGAFYHAGVAWWRDPGKSRWLGPIEDHTLGASQERFLTRLMGRRSTIGPLLGNGAGSKLQGEWAKFIRCIYDLGCPIERLSHVTRYVPGFEEGPGRAAIRVLGPVEFGASGSSMLRWYGSNSQSTNGNSLLLRLDFGRTRILLTGDLNLNSQQALLADYSGERQELACDVAKGCHHGSDDCSYEFLSVLGAACTIISSGDNEGHAHPRPTIVAASGQVGHTRIDRDRVSTPLVYSTEIARSVRLGDPQKARVTLREGSGPPREVEVPAADVQVIFEETRAGDLEATTSQERLDRLPVVPGIVYGLVNVRTDGDRILCANLNEKSGTWDVKTFRSRF